MKMKYLNILNTVNQRPNWGKAGEVGMARIYDMRQKEVINLADGTRFGYISDVEIDTKTGKITKLIVPGPGKVLGMFGREQEYQIKWDRIKKIGDDIILVDADLGDILVDSE